jgi:serine/threonine-protein kinase PpkA
MSADHVPNIPGFRTLRQLGRGGMATVYLAMQESVEREVALKIMAPQLSADPSFGERFLREARIAAKLHHRHVVSIFDVGVHNGFHYCTMEYLPGGPVMRRGAPPLALKPALRCIREISLALHYAQEKGFIHRDVKPDNILLREDGTCVLGDFGIARAAESGTIMTKTGAVVGTPHYMSPEQLRGRAIDGRADLYSLGVVFFQLITGRVPYEASDSLAVGIMHMTAPLPQMPQEYRILQPVLDRMLAKEPGDRFQTGGEIDAALARIEKRLASGDTDTPPPSTEFPTEPLPMRAQRTSGYDTQGALRTEPQLGRMDQVEDVGLRATPRPPLRAHTIPDPPRRGIWWLLLSIVVLAGAAYWQRPLVTAWVSSLLTPAPADEVQLADQALADGNLFGGDGRDALSLYAAALMLDASNARAQAGLTETLRRLRAELASTQPPDAGRIEAIAARLTSIRGFAAEADGLRALLVAPTNTGGTQPDQPRPEPVAGRPGIAELNAAQRAESEGHLDGPSGALKAFAAAQALDPDNAEARRGVDRVAGALTGQARSYLAAGNFSAAEGLQQQLAAIPALATTATALQQEIAAARQTQERKSRIPDLLAEAARLGQQGNWVDPGNRSAADRYRSVLGLDPANQEARTGLARAARAAMSQAEAAMEAREYPRAQSLTQRIKALAPQTPGLTDLRERIDDALEAAKGPSPEQLAERDALIRQGEQALANDQLLEPPGDSAYDKFRGALIKDPHSAGARAGMEAIGRALRQRIDKNLALNRATLADADISALDSVDPRFAGMADLKRRVAEVYASNGLRSLERGAVEQARSDLSGAERLDRDGPTVAQLRAALQGR